MSASMSPERWQQIQETFEAALRQDPAGRDAFLECACGGDAALRAEVLVLLAHAAQAEREHFLLPETPPPDDSRTVVAPPSGMADYEILGEPGRGGMSVVYRARQVKLNRLVALKLLLNGQYAGPDELARFRGEARALALLQHPNIVQIHDVGEHDGRPYFAMKLVDGGSLKERLDGTPWPPRQAAQLVQTLARAAHAAHLCGIIHRDLKAANILLQKSLTQRRKDAKKDQENSTGTPEPGPADPSLSSSGLCAFAPLREVLPKIADFGLAQRLDADAAQTPSGAFLGTPSYTAPEQAAGEVRRIGPATDVYALGGDPLRVPHRPALLPGRDAPGHPAPGDVRGAAAAPEAVPASPPRPGNGLPEVPAQAAATALRHRRGVGRGPAPLPRW
jgi:serine/threonine protein kinase